jgi:arylformamidase
MTLGHIGLPAQGRSITDDIAHLQVVDLTFALDEVLREPIVPWVPGVSLTPTATYQTLGRSVHRVEMATHCGTHIDPPAHFFEGGATIDQVPFRQLIGQAVLLDLTDKGPGEMITARDLERVGSDIQAGDIVLLHTGWDRYWGTPDYFWRAPYLAVDAAEWLVERRIATLGFDLPCPDDMHAIQPNSRPPIHTLLLSNNVILVEMLANLGQIPTRRFTFIVLPLKFKGGDGSPARAIALLT